LRLIDCTFICFDFETTGISAQVDRIVDIGAVIFNIDTDRQEVFSEIVNPQQPISASASAVHGLFAEDVCDAPLITDTLPAFLDFIPRDGVLVAHNAGFDRSFLASACAFNSMEPPCNEVICTLPICRRAWPDLKNYRLETVGRYLNLIDVEEHRGLADSLLLAQVFRRAIDRLSINTKEELFTITTPHSVAEVGMKPASVPDGFELFSSAIDNGSDMVIQYGDDSRAFRRITPERVITNGSRVYLLAVCHRDRIRKQFRFDRIHKFHCVAER